MSQLTEQERIELLNGWYGGSIPSLDKRERAYRRIWSDDIGDIRERCGMVGCRVCDRQPRVARIPAIIKYGVPIIAACGVVGATVMLCSIWSHS